MNPRDLTKSQMDRYHWLYERAEEAASDDLPLEWALQAVKDGYSSIEADRDVKEDL